MELFLLVVQIPVLIFLLRFIRKQHSDELFLKSYYYLLSLKVTAGLFLGILYFNYYKGGDTVYYHHDLNFLSNLFYTNFEEYLKLVVFHEKSSGIENELIYFKDFRAYSFIKIVSPLYNLSGSNYWLLSVYLSVFAFSGFWVLSNTLLKLFKLTPLAVLCAFFVFPTVVFWTSGVLKEGLVMGALCYILSIVLNLTYRAEKFSIYKCILVLLFSWLLLVIKFYYFAALFAVLIPYCLVKYFSVKGSFFEFKRFRITAFVCLLLFFGFAASLSHPLLHINKLAEALYANYTATLTQSNGVNVFYFEGLGPDILSFIPHLPKALSYGIFAPYLWHCKKIISLLTGVENTFLLIIFTTFILGQFKKESLKKIDLEELSLIVYIVALAICMAIATPNWGTLVRYKVGYLPFFLILVLNKNPLIVQLANRFFLAKKLEKKA